jgi:hypothetical protein
MRKHTAWLKATIQGIPTVASKTYVTRVTPGAIVAPPYVVIHPADGIDQVERMAGPRSTQHPRFTIHSVGVDADQCGWLAEQIKSRLVVNGFGVIPTVPGERCGRVWWDSPIPIQIDDDGDPVYFHVAECGFSSDPA